MTGGGEDIRQNLNIIEGNFPVSDKKDEGVAINLGISTAGADVGQIYSYDNGLRWAKIICEDEEFWQIEHGFIEYNADSVDYISKKDMTDMIRSGEMILNEDDNAETTDLLEESFCLDNLSDFNNFIEKVERYLFLNESRETSDYNYDWEVAWSEGKTPVEAAEEAILLEV